MEDFIHVPGWSQLKHPNPQRSFNHFRSLSNNTSRSAPNSPRPSTKTTNSTSALHTMATVSNAPGLPTPRLPHAYDEEGNMSTLLDPRSRVMSPATDSGTTTPTHHPDLSNEVATLSTKLINAINHQTDLDDILAATRHELEAARERVRQLEQENAEHANKVARGLLIEKSKAEAEKSRLITTLSDERTQRGEVEKEKKNIEQELENLTTALFEEANRMVIAAREEAQKEHDAVQKRNDQLKTQLADTESLLKSHQEQLSELKQVMEHITEDDQTNATAPSTPGFSKFDSKDDFPGSDVVHSASVTEPMSPTYPTSFTHLLQPVLRTDLSAYDDFVALLRMSKNVGGSRVSSGSYGGSIGLGLGLGGYTERPQMPSNGSTSSLSASAGTAGSSPATPVTPASSVSAGSNAPTSLTPLKETKFYKRAMAEDIEPTLRLDCAPSLSWLARRNVLSAICEGTLIVEPIQASTRANSFPCSLCGEKRKDSGHTRSHRFRTSDNDNAQRYPLCRYCLGRLRSTCDYMGFLRILKDGHWRADDEESEVAAWEESVRLREQMFWCRVGGGVILATGSHGDHAQSPRMSEDERKEQVAKLSDELELTGEIIPRDVTPVSKPSDELERVVEMIPKDITPAVDPHASATKRLSNTSAQSKDNLEQQAVEDDEAHFVVPSPVNLDEQRVSSPTFTSLKTPGEAQGSNKLPALSIKSLKVKSPEEDDNGKRLSITIPGAFE